MMHGKKGVNELGEWKIGAGGDFAVMRMDSHVGTWKALCMETINDTIIHLLFHLAYLLNLTSPH